MLDTPKMKSILSSTTDEQQTGTYKLSISQVPDAYVQHLETVGNDDLRKQIPEVVALAARKWEVLIKRADWQEYQQKNDLREPPPIKGPGRARKGSWREIAYLLPAYLIANGIASRTEWKVDEVAAEIEKFART
jgi:hypothetical protein